MLAKRLWGWTDTQTSGGMKSKPVGAKKKKLSAYPWNCWAFKKKKWFPQSAMWFSSSPAWGFAASKQKKNTKKKAEEQGTGTLLQILKHMEGIKIGKGAPLSPSPSCLYNRSSRYTHDSFAHIWKQRHLYAFQNQWKALIRSQRSFV